MLVVNILILILVFGKLNNGTITIIYELPHLEGLQVIFDYIILHKIFLYVSDYKEN